MSRSWIKLYCEDWLTGSIREENPITRDVLTGLFCLAGTGLSSNEGRVELIGHIPYTIPQLSEVLKLECAELETALKRLAEKERISVDKKGVITITNWQKYQSEYERTRKYRKPVVANAVQKVQPRVEKEGEGEGDIYTLYEDNIGMLTPIIADELQDAEKTYTAKWVKEAIEIAVENNKRSLKYIQGILEHATEAGKSPRLNKFKMQSVKSNSKPKPLEYVN